MKIIRLLSVALISVLFITSCKEDKPAYNAPLLKNIGDYSVTVTTKSKSAQMFFNQGIIMANGFNHAEAERSFREAVRLDSTFAMGYWGIAYVLGPNFNSTDNMGTVKEIRNAVKAAAHHSDHTSDWENTLIRAIGIKFPNDTSTDSEGFMELMKQAYTQFPDNAFVATLYAEAVMNLHPWDFYSGKGGEPRPWTPEVVSLLEKVMAIDPKNPLANHLYIHAMEASADVEKALTSAEKLKTLVPAAGHLVHMPSHIYINTGDYHEGSLVNEKAVVADSLYIAECQAQGYYPQLYYPHNYHFLAATAALEGRGARSIEAAFKTASLVDKKYFHEPGYETVVQHYLTIPDHVLVKFGQWEKILALPKPTEDLAYPIAIWHYARGMAYANIGNTSQAREELKSLNNVSKDPSLSEQLIWGINRVTDVCTLASKVLDAEISTKEGKQKEAIQLLSEALQIEDSLNYNEPPDWFFSVRHILGNVLLETKDYIQAEKLYREDLSHWPKNGFALSGLSESLKGQGKIAEADEVNKKFNEAWKYADTDLRASVIDPDKRKDLTLKIDKTSSNSLLYLASVMCLNK